MKFRFFAFFALTAALFFTVSCVKENSEPSEPQGFARTVTITAQTPSEETKTLLDPDDPSMSRILWSVKDSLKVFYGTSGTKFISANSQPESVCQFVSVGTLIFASANGELDEHHYLLGLYPFDDSATSSDGQTIVANLPSTQQAKEGTFTYFPSLGRSYNYIMSFYNICGGLRFTVKNDKLRYIMLTSNDGSPIAGRYEVAFSEGDSPRPVVKNVVEGKSSIMVEGPDKGYFKPGVWYYVTMLPGALDAGITVTFIGDKSTGVLSSSKALCVERSKFGSVEQIDSNAEFSTPELDEEGSANCYMKSQSGPARFKVDKELISAAKYADVLWESTGTTTAPKKKSLIDFVEYEKEDDDNAYIYMSIYGEIREGNALIALYDVNGIVLDSWHIWITSYEPAAEDYIMDRNLGAINANPGDPLSCGLFYQWGRKSPFLGLADFKRGDRAASSCSDWSSANVSAIQTGANVSEEARQNPTLYITSSTTPRDWYSSMASGRCDELWLDDKRSDNDPCPLGWKVPSGAQLQKAGLPDEIEFDENLYGFQYGGVWYPACGYLSFSSGNIMNFSAGGYYWTSTTNGNNACCMYFDNEGALDKSLSSYRASAMSVRCVRDNSPIPDPQKPVKTITYVAHASGESDILEYKLGTESVDKAFLDAKYTVTPATTASKLAASDLRLLFDGSTGGADGTVYAVDSLRVVDAASGLVEVFVSLPYSDASASHNFALSVVDSKARSYAVSAYTTADITVKQLEGCLAWFDQESISEDKTIVNDLQEKDWYTLYQNTGKKSSFTQPSTDCYVKISLDGVKYLTLDEASQRLGYDLNFSKKLECSYTDSDGGAVESKASVLSFAPVFNGKAMLADLGYQLSAMSSDNTTDVRNAIGWSAKAVQTVTLYHDNASAAVNSDLKAETSVKTAKHDMGEFEASGSTIALYWSYMHPVTSEEGEFSFQIPDEKATDSYDVPGITAEQVVGLTLEDSDFTFTTIQQSATAGNTFSFGASVNFTDSVIDKTLKLSVDNGHNYGIMKFRAYATGAPVISCAETLEDVEVNVASGTTESVLFITDPHSYKVKVNDALTDVTSLELPSGSYAAGINYMFGAPGVPSADDIIAYRTALAEQLGTMPLQGGTASTMTASYASGVDNSSLYFGPADLTYSDEKEFSATKTALFGESSQASFNIVATVKTEDVPFELAFKNSSVNTGGGYVEGKYKVTEQALRDNFEVRWIKGDKAGQPYDGPAPLAISFSAQSDDAEGQVALPQGKVDVVPGTATVAESNVLAWGTFNGLSTNVSATLHYGTDTAKEGNTVSAQYSTDVPFSSFDFAEFDGSDRKAGEIYVKDVTGSFTVKDKDGNATDIGNFRTSGSNVLFDATKFDNTVVELDWANAMLGEEPISANPFFALKVEGGKILIDVNKYLGESEYVITVPVKVNWYLNGYSNDDEKRDKRFDGSWTLKIGKK